MVNFTLLSLSMNFTVMSSPLPTPTAAKPSVKNSAASYLGLITTLPFVSIYPHKESPWQNGASPSQKLPTCVTEFGSCATCLPSRSMIHGALPSFTATVTSLPLKGATSTSLEATGVFTLLML